MSSTGTISVLGALAVSATMVCSGPVQADAVADFYKGKTVTIVSAGSAGGAHGVYGQVISAHMQKYFPGKPTIIIQYMAGAGGNKAMSYLFNATTDNGTFLGIPLQDLIFNARIGMRAVKYDPKQAHFLGGADVTRTTVTVMKSSGVTTLEEAKQKEVLMAASGTAAQPYMIPIVLNNLLNTKFRVITGYRGINPMHLAMERGEVQGLAASWQSITTTKQDWIQKDLVANLITVAMEREPDLPQVPSLAELVSSEEDKSLIRLMAASSVHGRAWIAHGGIPEARLAALRKAYANTLADPAFQADAKKRDLPLRPVTWALQEERKRDIIETPDKTVQRLKSMLNIKKN